MSAEFFFFFYSESLHTAPEGRTIISCLVAKVMSVVFYLGSKVTLDSECWLEQAGLQKML